MKGVKWYGPFEWGTSTHLFMTATNDGQPRGIVLEVSLGKEKRTIFLHYVKNGIDEPWGTHEFKNN